jgi:hypothetical protein
MNAKDFGPIMSMPLTAQHNPERSEKIVTARFVQQQAGDVLELHERLMSLNRELQQLRETLAARSREHDNCMAIARGNRPQSVHAYRDLGMGVAYGSHLPESEYTEDMQLIAELVKERDNAKANVVKLADEVIQKDRIIKEKSDAIANHRIREENLSREHNRLTLKIQQMRGQYMKLLRSRRKP